MRSIHVLAAVAASMAVTGAAATAADKPAKPKERKVCRTIEEPGRITPKRICRIVPREESAQDDRRSPRGEAGKTDSSD
jgi:hypothetical protein